MKHTHRVTFQPKEVDNTDGWTVHNIVSQIYMATLAPNVSTIIWTVRWTQKGVQPVKPALHFSGALTVPPGRVVLLCGPPEVLLGDGAEPDAEVSRRLHCR